MDWWYRYQHIQFINKSIWETYYGYIDIDQNCWGVTSNSSYKYGPVCAPIMFDPTGAYWICRTIIPCFISLVVFCYAFYCVKHLYHHLYKRKHNWILEPSRSIKITAILIATLLSVIFGLIFLYSIMLYVSFRKTGIYPPSNPSDDYYQPISVISKLIGVIGLFLYGCYIPLVYSHVSYVIYIFFFIQI